MKAAEKAKQLPELSPRAREILQWAISTFVSTGKPVGSRKLARKSRENLSAATVRNIMADLEEMGYLKQPHRSAGRVPTDKAYRLYVDSMVERRELPLRDRQVVDRGMQGDETAGDLMARTSQILSQVSRNVGIVISPPISQVALQNIQFIKLTDKRILVIVVSRSGIVQNRVIHMEEEYPASELEQAARYLTEHFLDKTLLEIIAVVHQMLGADRDLYDSFVQRAIRLSTQAFAEALVDFRAEVYLDGTSNLTRAPEFSDIKRMRALLETMEQRSRLAGLLNRCVKEDTEEVRITIGAENALSGIEDCTLITSRYIVDEKTQGSLGILGPTRMEYGRAISLVEYVARLVGKALGGDIKR
jgi:heat-inducible transcriptional repressor